MSVEIENGGALRKMTTDRARTINVYVENAVELSAEYAIDELALRMAAGPLSDRLAITVRSNADPDMEALRRAEFFVGARFDPEQLKLNGKSLRNVHTTSAGVERYVPLDWLRKDAVLTNSSGVHAQKAGEFGLMALLMLNDLVPAHMTNQRAHRWVKTLSTPIAGKTVLIFGVGALGGAVAQKAKLLGLNVVGTTRSGARHPFVDAMHASGDLDAVLPLADFVVVSCPLTALTRGAIGGEQLALMKRGAGLLNISRAAVVDYVAVADALHSGQLSGAILDVFAQEPLPADAPWWDVPNLVVIPHVSSDTASGYTEKSLQILVENIQASITGRPFKNVVSRSDHY